MKLYYRHPFTGEDVRAFLAQHNERERKRRVRRELLFIAVALVAAIAWVLL